MKKTFLAVLFAVLLSILGIKFVFAVTPAPTSSASCRTQWTRVVEFTDSAPISFEDFAGGGYTSDSSVPSGLYERLKSYTQNGCSFRGVVEEVNNDGITQIQAFDCELVEVREQTADKTFQCMAHKLEGYPFILIPDIFVSLSGHNTYFNATTPFTYNTGNPSTAIQSIRVRLFAKK